VLLTDWAAELLAECTPLAAALDAAHGGTDYADALAAARAAAAAPDSLPSARVLAAMQSGHGGSYTAFVRAQSAQTRDHLLALPWSTDQQATFEAEAQASLAKRRAIEAATTGDFESWRLAYLAPERLRV
jgi:glutamate--cysteine ligase